jgi:hypothetical protein
MYATFRRYLLLTASVVVMSSFTAQLVAATETEKDDVTPAVVEEELAHDEAMAARAEGLAEIEADREGAVYEAINMWMSDAEAEGSAEQLIDAVNRATSEQLLAISEAESYEQVNAILLGQPATNEGVSQPLALGDLNTDLVYTPVSPCRIFDTRLAGGAIGAGSTREFYVYGSLGFQGGSTCSSPRGEPRGVHLNVTVVPGGNGYVTVYPANVSPPLASLVNFKLGTNIANAAIVKTYYSIGPREIEVYASATTHVIADVLGYFYEVDKDDFVVRQVTDINGGTTNLTSGGGCTNYAGSAVSIFAPTSGTIKVDAQATMRLFHNAGTSEHFVVAIGTTTTDCGGLTSHWQVPSGLPNSGSQFENEVSVSRTFTIPSAGTRTYYLNATRSGGTGTGGFWYANMQLTFYPDP